MNCWSKFESPAEAPEINCGGVGCEGEECQDCCPHDDLDHGICLYCEKDFSEDIAARAYDAAKDARKYGDVK